MPFQTTPAQQSISKQLGQARPANTTAASVYSPADGVTAELDTIVICNTSGSTATFRLFHDDDGTTYDETTALYWDVSATAASRSIEIDLSLYMGNADGNLAIRTGTGNALTFTVYGRETQLRAR